MTSAQLYLLIAPIVVLAAVAAWFWLSDPRRQHH